uniref:PLP-dependent transferase n=1 Tax=Nocardia cyriacigeorgica TaxID=135487 RepID=UPI002458BA90
HSHVANSGDVRSQVLHPPSTTPSQHTPDQLLAAGVTPRMNRLYVGIEGITDIHTDLRGGLPAAAR